MADAKPAARIKLGAQPAPTWPREAVVVRAFDDVPVGARMLVCEEDERLLALATFGYLQLLDPPLDTGA